jgi:surfactin synthase thioesterase subunit
VDLVAVELPGRGRRRAEPPAGSARELVDGLLPAIGSIPPPYALLGHSMGALLALALTRRLLAEGTGPLALVVSAMPPPAPDRPAPERPVPERPVPERPRPHPPGWLDPRAGDDELLHQLVVLGGLPAAVLANHHAKRLLLPPLRADLLVTEELRAGTRLDGRPLNRPVLALSAASDQLAPPHLVAGWRSWTSAGFAQQVFPGGHLFLTRDPDTTARRLANGLDVLGLRRVAA